ncbi:MAG: serine/threonine protein kinase [Deltaproteobacteria bacterium]|nr:serine/threonine protein kinase [Deltaproteobacteria bacterium]
MLGSEDEGGLVPGAVVGGRYRVVRMLGEGGLATVYEVDALDGRGRRAIKLLQPQFRAQRNVVERFYTEARACHELRHPNIASVEEFAYTDDGSPYIVMELLAGQSLDDYLRSHPPLPPERAGAFVLDALGALSLAHSRGIIHRDLKPPNLFVVPRPDGSLMLKVLDFGIAKVIDLAGGMASRTRTGALLGTPGYMSPEQLRDSKSCDVRSDLWSLGVVLHEMLTHRHPYGAQDFAARAVAILRDEAKPIGEVAPALAAWQRVLGPALARDVAARFPSADAMAAAVREVLSGAGAGGAGAVIPPLPRPNAGPTLTARARTLSSGAVDGGYGQVDENALHGGGRGHEVGVTTAASLDPPSIVWWGALLLALASFAVGLLMGYLLTS